MNKCRPIAVVGMAGVFPGALDLETFWHNIVHKVDAVADVPPERWIVPPATMVASTPTPDKAVSKRACLISGFRFDPGGIDIDPELLAQLDPLYHLLLHAGREALSECPLTAAQKKRTGTILAAIALPTDGASRFARTIFDAAFEHKLFGRGDAPPDVPLVRNECLAAKVTSLPAALLASGMGLKGGSFTLDAACASSLYAVKLACDELAAGRADVMLAGGVSRPESLYTQVGFSQLRALSASGRCAPFDASADGLVVGEGAGVLVLKRLEDALAACDTIHAVIAGIGLSNDISGNLLSPDSEGQLRAMHQAYAAAGWSPRDVDLIECHGAGTPRGDATELNSLIRLWGAGDWRTGQCPIGSVKSMIGHLLTAAGAAGMIKTLLAIRHGVLPPSLNFSQPPAASPLNRSPFRVQTAPEPWCRRDARTPRRAAVSAFGFGGINAHVLFEEWHPADARTPVQRGSIEALPSAGEPVAVVGMHTAVGSIPSLKRFQELTLCGEDLMTARPDRRFKGCDPIAGPLLAGRASRGAFLRELAVSISDFRIPPNEIPDIIPQHLLMLQVAAGAMRDAGLLQTRRDRPDMSVLVGMEFDFEATDFHLRWNLPNAIGRWAERYGLELDDPARARWLEHLLALIGAPLTANRTLGALGGIIASRIAREFRLGGPSFVVSAESAAGLRALEIGVRSLQRNEIAAVLVGAVDLTGDVRSLLLADRLAPFTRHGRPNPFDRSADGSLPGEGAAAVVIKRYDRAVRDNDRIYAVIRGIGGACDGGIDRPLSIRSYAGSLQRSIEDAGVDPATIDFFEAHGSGRPPEDRLEIEALSNVFGARDSDGSEACAVGSVKAGIGDTGAAAGLFSLVRSCLCLYQEIIPPLKHYTRPAGRDWPSGTLHLPREPQYWLRNRRSGPRRAGVAAISPDGNCMHVILEEAMTEAPPATAARIHQQRKRPLGPNSRALFAVSGDTQSELADGLSDLRSRLERAEADGRPLETAARQWHLKRGASSGAAPALVLTVSSYARAKLRIDDARQALRSGSPPDPGTSGEIHTRGVPLGDSPDLALVFPGSGNHYLGMGRETGVRWPEILRQMDIGTPCLKAQMLPQHLMPWRSSWQPGWEQQAADNISRHPLYPIFGQVLHGQLIVDLFKGFGVKPDAVIGYSLGESTGLFATGAWTDRDEMLRRMRTTDLFTRQLAGPCEALRKAWRLPPDTEVCWRVAAVNRPARETRAVVEKWPHVRLLIVNTDTECVIGGLKNEVEAAVEALGCEAVYLEGVVTVHCDAVVPVIDAYRALHLFPVSRPPAVRYYSCARAEAYELSSEHAADAIVAQAVGGFDFTRTIRHAYADGVRIFLETGPHSSCTRMIHAILGEQPHLAVSAGSRGEDEFGGFIKVLGALMAQGVPVDLGPLYGGDSGIAAVESTPEINADRTLKLQIGGRMPDLKPPPPTPRSAETASRDRTPPAAISPPGLAQLFTDALDAFQQNIRNTSQAHQMFLDFSDGLQQASRDAVVLQTQLIDRWIADAGAGTPPLAKDAMANAQPHIPSGHPPGPPIAVFSRDMCLEFAVGSAARVLGPEFAPVDTYPTRVRLPDEPLMLVDRITAIEGRKGSLGPGRITTEHDVFPDAWYLDGGRAPVCISVEAGQADLFLCAYLGIDLAVKGRRAYRLLDATIKFHRGLPRPGDVIRYEIAIDRFVRQGDTYLFFFRFEGFIGDSHLITMTDGCAGFFTPQEVENSGGIIRSEADRRKRPTPRPAPPPPLDALMPREVETYDEASLDALRAGRPADCFGHRFAGIAIPDALKLPGGRMKLIDRVLSLDPFGGRFGLGLIRAQADIHPDDWFLTCHFMDDMVMPGTLMYECCAHTLRVFLQRMGWFTQDPDAAYEPVAGVKSVLKCRGPVTPDTHRVDYEVEIKEIGFADEPYVRADAHMFADGRYIVHFTDMSMRLAGVSPAALAAFWEKHPTAPAAPEAAGKPARAKTPLYDRQHILQFAAGKPSLAFGPPYLPFDRERVIARLPSPPFSFMDRVVAAEPPPWILKPGGWIQSEYDIPAGEWYFRAERTGCMPFAVLLEIALQPCGWLAAYLGSALRSGKDLKFRNLGGSATLHANIPDAAGRLTVRARLTKVAEAVEMIIEHFDFEVLQADRIIYAGNTYFGFFTPDALARQVGIREAEIDAMAQSRPSSQTGTVFEFPDEAPLTPQDRQTDPSTGLALPARALRMIDRIDCYLPAGGPDGLGYISGSKTVDPGEWFFKAHFYQDPVCPGSLGIESFLQLLKFAALQRWPELSASHRFALLPGQSHQWMYRGQVIPANRRVEVEAVITSVQQDPQPQLTAEGLLKVDGINIYRMERFGLCLVPTA